MELDRSLLSWGSQPEPDGWSTGGSPHSVFCAVCPSAVCKSKPTGPLPGCVSQARGPPRACVWSSESELRGGEGRLEVGALPACGWPFHRLPGHAVAPWLEATPALCIHGMALNQWPRKAGQLGVDSGSAQTVELGGSP